MLLHPKTQAPFGALLLPVGNRFWVVSPSMGDESGNTTDTDRLSCSFRTFADTPNLILIQQDKYQSRPTDFSVKLYRLLVPSLILPIPQI